MTKLQELLIKLDACDTACVWVGEKTPKEAWETCERADWMLWLVGKMAGKKDWPTRKEVVLAACACAETALKFVPKGENRPRLAIKTAREWVAGRSTLVEVRKAADAAYAAADAAAYAAAYAADAAAAADAYASRRKAQKRMAAIVRKMLKVPLGKL